MPRRAIELLQPEGEVLGAQNTDFRHDLASVRGIPLFKLFLLYPQSWWQTAGVERGRSLTDLPLRQCYYWPVGPEGKGVPGPGEPGLLMAYDDLLNVGFWGALDTRPQVHKAGSRIGSQMTHRLPLFSRVKSPSQPPPPADPFAARLHDNWEAHAATEGDGPRDAPSTHADARYRQRAGADRRRLHGLVAGSLRWRRAPLEPELQIIRNADAA